MVALHGLKVNAADLLHAHVMVPNREKIRTILGQEIGDDTGTFAIIVRAIYGLKNMGASLRTYLT